jgi:hypothetical protein
MIVLIYTFTELIESSSTDSSSSSSSIGPFEVEEAQNPVVRVCMPGHVQSLKNSTQTRQQH